MPVVICGQPQDRRAKALKVEQEKRVAGGGCLATSNSWNRVKAERGAAWPITEREGRKEPGP